MNHNFELDKDNAQVFKTSENLEIVYRYYNRENENKLPLLTFNYGLVCSNVHWKEQIPFFEKLKYPILIHDYRGHYESDGINDMESIDFESISNDLKELIISIGHTKTILIGHSMGVNVCLEFAKLYPQMVIKQVLLSGGVYPPHDVMFNSNIIEICSPYLEKFTGANSLWFDKVWQHQHKLGPLRRGILYGGFNPEKVSEDFIEIYLKKIGELPKELFFHMINKMKSHCIISALKFIKTRSLIMGGDLDKIMPNYLQFSLHDILQNSEFYLIKNGSHVPQLDYPGQINERIKFFIEN